MYVVKKIMLKYTVVRSTSSMKSVSIEVGTPIPKQVLVTWIWRLALMPLSKLWINSMLSCQLQDLIRWVIAGPGWSVIPAPGWMCVLKCNGWFMGALAVEWCKLLLTERILLILLEPIMHIKMLVLYYSNILRTILVIRLNINTIHIAWIYKWQAKLWL